MPGPPYNAAETGYTRRMSTPEQQPTPPTVQAELVPTPVTDATLDRLVATLNTMQRAAGFAFAREVGWLLVNELYGGDLAGWRSHGEKDASFRKLAARAEDGQLQMSAASLYRCVALVELEARLGVSAWKHLGLAHVRAVFGLPESDQARLLRRADDEGWTVDQIERRAAAVRKRLHRRGGRAPLPAFVKGIGKLGRMLEDRDEVFGDLEALEALDPASAARLCDTVRAMKAQCEALEARLQARMGSDT